ncbi:MAG: hypothetical protein IAF02_09520 [Anaerolineae bacterium]|nr:hypothetical protein [Anaerolineae bacterium]
MKTKLLHLTILLICLYLVACVPASGGQASGAVTAVSPTQTTISTQTIEHAGITFTYDPDLLGDITIQDVPATANEGLFEQLTPAHTWFGFAPEGVQSDASNQWVLDHEAQVLVFNLHDFGSFAPSDARGREWIGKFQQMMAERPLTFYEEVPILPLLNAMQMFQAQVQWLDFENGFGVRFLTAYTQDTVPVSNERLVYVFYGMTDDGLHGITAVFPLAAAALPDTAPAMTEAEYTAFNQNYAAEMTAVTDQLNALANDDFSLPLSQLDALVQSIYIAATETDFPMTVLEPQQQQIMMDTDIFTSPTGDEVLTSLEAGEAVVVNATSQDGQRSRILCPDGTTGNCWLDTEAIEANGIQADPVFYTGSGMPEIDAVVEITVISGNNIYEGPGETYRLIGELKAGEVVSIFGADETEQWWAIECPRNLGLACWVVNDPTVNEPTGFFMGDGWQDITSEWVTFRVPGDWQLTAVTPGMGSVLADWYLGIPGVENDQSIAFFVPPFDQLMPDDVISEQPFAIGGQPGTKWVRGDEGYTSYDYYTAGTADTQAAGAGSFGLHVTVAEADPELESMLDMVAASIQFLPPPEAAETSLRFDHYLPFFQPTYNTLAGLVRYDAGWQLSSVLYPPDLDSIDSDYAPATDQMLSWNYTGGEGVGPGNLSTGALTLTDLTRHTNEVVVPENVVSAGWAPNGLDFAYILGTPTTYELHWRTANGDDKLLAVDVPHSLRVSPNGRFVAFTRESHYGLLNAVPGLYVVDIETGEETQVSSLDRAGYGGSGLAWKPQWSMDSSQLLLYATADDDRAPVPHEQGYVWAAVDGSFSHFIPDSVLLAQFDDPLSSPSNYRCLDVPLLFVADLLVGGVGECQPMAGGGPESSQPAIIALDNQTGTVKSAQFLPDLASVKLLAWDVPGESVLLLQGEDVISYPLP